MGKGDQKTKRGKIISGSYGVRRPKKKRNPSVVTEEVKPAVKKAPEKPKKAVEKSPDEKPAAKKKAPAKKKNTKKEAEKSE
ncbi:MAG: 30S ribosomal protein THX [Bacteroidales bacterium]|nr:30S ribosomal protein THX [Bacteroidales bacterium]